MKYVAYAIGLVMAVHILCTIYLAIRRPSKQKLDGPVSGWGTPEG
jgi:hypothetical protein